MAPVYNPESRPGPVSPRHHGAIVERSTFTCALVNPPVETPRYSITFRTMAAFGE